MEPTEPETLIGPAKGTIISSKSTPTKKWVQKEIYLTLTTSDGKTYPKQKVTDVQRKKPEPPTPPTEEAVVLTKEKNTEVKKVKSIDVYTGILNGSLITLTTQKGKKKSFVLDALVS